jgi:hypothetical protein
MQRALQASGAEDPSLKERLDKSLADGITALVRNQNSDGGWSWIRGGDSDPYISTYVLSAWAAPAWPASASRMRPLRSRTNICAALPWPTRRWPPTSPGNSTA